MKSKQSPVNDIMIYDHKLSQFIKMGQSMKEQINHSMNSRNRNHDTESLILLSEKAIRQSTLAYCLTLKHSTVIPNLLSGKKVYRHFDR